MDGTLLMRQVYSNALHGTSHLMVAKCPVHTCANGVWVRIVLLRLLSTPSGRLHLRNVMEKEAWDNHQRRCVRQFDM